MICIKSNTTIDDNSNFCMYCGAKVIKMCCPNCGSDNFPKDAHFCPDCGYKLQNSESVPNVANDKISQKAYVISDDCVMLRYMRR